MVRASGHGLGRGGPVNFSVTTLEEAGFRVINVSGEVDAATVPRLQAQFEAAAGADGPVIVDLCGTSFMDSSGQFALLVFRQRLLDRDRRLVPCSPPRGPPPRPLRLSRPDTML